MNVGWISSAFGRRLDPFTNQKAFHRGIDISAPRGTPIHATADGKVKFSGRNGGYGLTVRIDHGNWDRLTSWSPKTWTISSRARARAGG